MGILSRTRVVFELPGIGMILGLSWRVYASASWEAEMPRLAASDLIASVNLRLMARSERTRSKLVRHETRVKLTEVLLAELGLI